MLNISFQGLGSEFSSDAQPKDDNSWIQWRHLILFDQGTERNISEWFYVAACSKEYSLKNNLAATEKEATLVQDSFDEKALLEFAKLKFDTMSFRDWEDFHTKMPMHFIHDETD